jgi:serine/threonine protein kinase
VIGLGPWTTEAHLKRFRREAEAAAGLDHPCIVPIYEVSECEGCCYFSMNLIEGGQLDEVVKREPIPIRRAVELIAKVARTVHYAHEHGILHRDIKPGNILLDEQGDRTSPILAFELQRCIQPAKAATENEDTSFLRHNHLSCMRQIAYSTRGNLRNGNRASPASGPSNPQWLEFFWQKLQKLLSVPGFFRSKEASRCRLPCEIKVGENQWLALVKRTLRRCALNQSADLRGRR